MNEQENKPTRTSRTEDPRAAKTVNSILQGMFLFFYILGRQVKTCLRLAAQWSLRPLKALGHLFYRVADALVLRHLRALRQEAHRFVRGFSIAAQRVRVARLRGRLIAAVQVLALPFLAIRRHKKGLAKLANVLMPVAAALILGFTVRYWSNLSFGLALDYDGERFGYIADETVFDSAAAMVNARVGDAEAGTLEVRTPKLTLTVLSDEKILDEAAVCDKIIKNSGDEFAEATGLYIDNELVGTMTAADELDGLLSDKLAAWRSDNCTAEFVQSVHTQQGLYPVTTVLTPARMQALLDAEREAAQYYTVQEGDTLGAIASRHGMTLADIQSLNGITDPTLINAGQQLRIRGSVRRLQVRTTEITEFDEEIAYQTVTEKDPTAKEGTRKVKTKGQVGSRHVKRQTVSVDGTVQSVSVLSAETTVEPVDEVIVIGTKKESPQSVYTPGVQITEGDGVTTGNMLWPVPAVHAMSQRFHAGHSGIDIANGPVNMFNQPVVAADGGTVTLVNTNRDAGYGIYVIVDHGNGLTTLYAHLNSVSVTQGQKVTRGQQLGRAGSTGWSTGPHLHFEVRSGGHCVNPLNYVSY